MSRICQIIVDSSPGASSGTEDLAFDWLDGFQCLSGLSSESQRFLKQNEDSFRELSLKIFGRPKVLSILATGFSFGLTRNTPWDLRRINLDEVDCYITAARLYKRGVTTINPTHLTGKLPLKIKKRRSYTIDFFDGIYDCFASLTGQDCLVVDKAVLSRLPIELQPRAITLEPSESNKNIDELAVLLPKLRAHKEMAKSDQVRVYIVGGGITGDVAGMAAGLLDMDTIYVPTTLVAMADSSVGGKVGINFEPWGKNQIGLFHDPIGVKVCLDWLSTLSRAEFRAGIAECLKHALLRGDLDLWSALTASSDSCSTLSIEMVCKIIQVKVDIVSRDPLEKGERAVLNLGHTFGHVVESLAMKQGKKFLHGECVAVGLIHALRLSKKYFGMHADPLIKDLLVSGILPSQERLIALLGAGSEFHKERDQILGLLFADKKSRADNLIRFVLLKSPGEIVRADGGGWTISFSPEDTWQDLRETWRILCG